MVEYKKLMFMTKEKLSYAINNKKYSFDETYNSNLDEFESNDVLAVKIRVNSPVKVEGVCKIENMAQINEFAKEIQSTN